MLRDTLRDLQWRRRRFAIAAAGTSLVFAMALLLAGVAQSFRAETQRTIDALAIDAWVVPKGAVGSFNSLFSQSEAGRVAASPGVERAEPMLFFPQPIAGEKIVDANVFGHRAGGIGTPPLSQGRAVSGPGEAVVDEALDLAPGSSFHLGDESFTVVGLTSGLTLFAGAPNIYITTPDMQRAAFNGLPVATGIAVQGRPARLPEGLKAQSIETVKANVLRPLTNAISAIDLVQFLLWIVAACIVGAVVYLSALERGRDFAVFKATGASGWSLLGGLAIQSTILSFSAAVVGTGLANLLAPGFPLKVAIPGRSYLLLFVVSIVIGLVASTFAVRRASSIDPALAFGGP
jgi:putative ABC transport system permease protein